jgi:hypothetical protein
VKLKKQGGIDTDTRVQHRMTYVNIDQLHVLCQGFAKKMLQLAQKKNPDKVIAGVPKTELCR